MPPSQSRGFSLTEILIALALILLFLTLPVLAFTQFSKKSRDDKRRSDLLTISQAIESYKAEKGFYPPDLEALVAEGYLPELPRDPRHGQLIPGETGIYYGYSYETDGETYTLSTRLENHVRGGGGGSGSGSLSSGNVSGRFIGTGSGAIAGFFTLRGVVSEGVLRANFTGTVSGNANGSISGSLSGQINGSAAGEVVGECALTSGVVTGTSFSGTYATCTLTPVAPSGGGPGVFIVKPRDLRGRDIPIAAITDSALTPTVVIPTKTPYLSPTRMVTGIPDPNRPDEFIPSPTPMPCTRTIVCAGACVQPQNRCGSYPSTKGGCLYTTRPNFATCRQVPAPDQPCTVTGDTCDTGAGEYPVCSGTNCIPNCNTGASCTGVCQAIAGRCAPNSYSSTRGGCTWTTFSGGGSCTPVAAPDQVCSITSQSCTSPPYCETSTSFCRNCLNNNHCPNPSAPRCSSYSCSACLGDVDCARWPGRVCSASTGGCVEPTFSRAFTNNSFGVGTAGEMIVAAAASGFDVLISDPRYQVMPVFVRAGSSAVWKNDTSAEVIIRSSADSTQQTVPPGKRLRLGFPSLGNTSSRYQARLRQPML